MIVDDNRLILISYPTGGFGNFIYYMLSTFSSNTVKVDNSSFSFCKDGNSHDVLKYTPIYYKDPDQYTLPPFNTENKILILCDNGITNDKYHKINNIFKNQKIVRMVIDEDIRPVIYTTCVIKGMTLELNDETSSQVKNNWSDYNEDYAVRENYTLLYHNWPFEWNVDKQSNIINVSIKELIDDAVTTIEKLIIDIEGTVVNRKDLVIKCKEWFDINKQYFTPYFEWNAIETALEKNHNYNMQHITNLHVQGYINYKIEKKYNINIPVYDYKDWFMSTNDILKMV